MNQMKWPIIKITNFLVGKTTKQVWTKLFSFREIGPNHYRMKFDPMDIDDAYALDSNGIFYKIEIINKRKNFWSFMSNLKFVVDFKFAVVDNVTVGWLISMMNKKAKTQLKLGINGARVIVKLLKNEKPGHFIDQRITDIIMAEFFYSYFAILHNR